MGPPGRLPEEVPSEQGGGSPRRLGKVFRAEEQPLQSPQGRAQEEEIKEGGGLLRGGGWGQWRGL